jgi:hypothetical protein
VNFRFILAGLLLGILAGGFFLFMLDLAPQSNDPKELLRVAGMAAGTAAGLGVALILMGLLGVGKKRKL